MKRLAKVAAFLLAATVLISSLPLSSASADEASVLAAASDPDMKFVQKGTVSSDGILTMTLKVRTSQLGEKHESAPEAGLYTGRFVSGGYLAFQVDAVSLRPITLDGTEIVDFGGKTAYVGATNSTSLVGDFLAPDGQGLQINKVKVEDGGVKYTNFETEIAGSTGTTKFYTQYSGLMVSSARASIQNGGVLDCYLQFQMNGNQGLLLQPDAEGYVDVVDLRFQCYSGTDEEGNDKPASGENAGKILFAKSIRVPEGVGGDASSISNVDDVVSQFYTKLNQPGSAPMAKGGAGFSEMQYVYKPAADGYVFSPCASYYYYNQAPQSVVWGAPDPNPATPLDGVPEVLYENMDNPYIVESFCADVANTYDTDEDLGANEPDFRVPSSERSGMPRYKIPTVEDEERLSDPDTMIANGGWVPERYDDDPADQNQVMLKYNLFTNVTLNSGLKPELDDVDVDGDGNVDAGSGLDAFLHGVRWRFAFTNNTYMDSYNYDLTGTPKTVQILRGRDGSGQDLYDTYTVQTAVYNDTTPGFKYNEEKIQVVTDEDGNTMVTPVGIMLDFHENTPVTYTGMDNTFIDADGGAYAPQLRITPDAADTDSYLWDEDNKEENGSVYLSAVYEAPAGGQFNSIVSPMQIRIYKNTASADKVDAVFEEMKVTGPEGTEVNGFSIPVNIPSESWNGESGEDNDILLLDGIPFTFYVHDQYGFPTYDKKTQKALKPTVAVEALDETKTLMTSRGKTEMPFILEQTGSSADGGYTYALKYGKDSKGRTMTVNDVTEGYYKITAFYNGAETYEWVFYVAKEEDYFNYFDTNFTKAYTKGADGVKVVNLDVPIYNDDGSQGSSGDLKITLKELANQWRDPESETQQNNEAKYDLFPDMRDSSGALTLSRVATHFDIKIARTDESGNEMSAPVSGLDLSELDTGVFRYTSAVPDQTEIYVTVSAKLKDSTAEPKTDRYKFVFVREASVLKNVYLTNKTLSMQVPTEAEEQQVYKGPLTLDLIPMGRNQYWGNYDLDQAQADNGLDAWQVKFKEEVVASDDPNYTWMLKSDHTVKFRDVVTGSRHNNQISITHETQKVTLHGWIQFGDTGEKIAGSDFEVPIARAPSVASSIETTGYDKTSETVPSRNASGPKYMTPKGITVKDQFGEVMTPPKKNEDGTIQEGDYSMLWTFPKDQMADMSQYPKIHLDKDFGTITIDPCAASVPYAFKTRVQILQNGAPVADLNREFENLTIVRNPLVVDYVEVDQSQLKYPDEESEKKYHMLTASSLNQYSVDNQLEKVPEVWMTWRVEEVTLQDGTVYKRVDHIDETTGVEVPGGIKFNNQGTQTTEDDTYTDEENSFELMVDSGRLNLDKAKSREKSPKQIKVVGIYNHGLESVPKTINIDLGESKPDHVEIWSNSYQGSMETPVYGQTHTRKLNAYVRDQFGFQMKDAASKVVWSLKDPPAGVTLINGDTISVDHNCPDKVTITFAAAYTYTDSNTNQPVSISEERSIRVSRDAGTPTSIEIVGIKNNDGFEVPLPGMKTDGKWGQSSFTLVWNVRDQFNVVMPGEAVTLELTANSDPYGLVKRVNQNGNITYTCTDQWRDGDTANGLSACNADTTVSITAYVTNDPTVTTSKQITLKRQADVPGYAVPEMVTTAGSYVPSERFPDKILIPSPDYMTENVDNGHGGWTYANFTAKVYSQYGTEMPGSNAEIKLVKPESGLKLTADKTNSTALLEVSSLMGLYETNITAVPTGDGALGIQRDESIVPVYLDRGAGYPDTVALGTTSLRNDNPEEGYVGLWPVDPQKDNIIPPATPDSDSYSVTDTFTFCAQVVDQYKADYTKIDSTFYPVWTLKENYPGVKFADTNDKDTAGNVRGTLKTDSEGNQYYEVELEVTGKALGQGETSKTIQLVSHIAHNNQIYKPGNTHYESVQSFTLKKGTSRSTHLYFQNVKEEGTGDDREAVLSTPWQRPTLAENALSYTLETIVYDQYGYVKPSAPVSVRLIESSITSQEGKGASVQPAYAEGVDPEKDPSARPVKYLILQGENTVAEFTPSTATMKVYTGCTLTEMVFEASSTEIPGTTKQVRVPLETAHRKPLTMELLREADGAVVTGDIVIEDLESPDFSQRFRTIVRDQFGEAYTGSEVYGVWTLLMKDEEGNYIPYMDYDEEDAERDPQDWTISMRPGTSSRNLNMVLTVRPSQFVKGVDLRVLCQLKKGAATDDMWEGIESQMDFAVRQRKHSHSGGGGSGIAGMCVVTYNAGENGTLRGIASENVLVGGKPLQVPKVLPSAGYGVLGWLTSEGEFVESPAQVEIWQDTEFTVVYNDITKHKFLTGYDDHTVRPSRAVTRAEFVTMLVRAINNYDPNKEYSHPFQDVDPRRYFDSYIGYAFSLGIISGDGKGNFRPNDTITRAEASRMVAEAAELTGKAEDTRAVGFTDVDAEKWYAPYVSALAGAGIINGYTDGTFRPANQLKRAEAVTLLVQIMRESPSKEELERIRADGLSPFTDVNKSSWAYPYILRAAGAA